MHDAYSYVTVTGGRGRARGVADALASEGAVVVGTWSGAGGIGWWDDEVTILAAWPDGAPSEDRSRAVPSDGAEIERMRATARPTTIAPLEPGGVFAHRWFEFSARDWDEFLELSTEAWPAFEAAYDATIEGFLRSDDTVDEDGRVLLITRYPSLAGWEASRGALRDTRGDVAESGRRFLRRRELTRRSIVRTAILL